MAPRSNPRKLVHPLEGYLGYQLRRAANFMQADLVRRSADLGLTIVEMSTLLVIEANPGVTQSEIGRLIAIKRANMVPLAAGLIERGLILASPVDGSSLGLRLTAVGMDLAARVRQRVAENEALLFRNLADDTAKSLPRQLQQIWREA
jgi:DNA-binding MarR family transcriptional regulator